MYNMTYSGKRVAFGASFKYAVCGALIVAGAARGQHEICGRSYCAPIPSYHLHMPEPGGPIGFGAGPVALGTSTTTASSSAASTF